MARQSITQIIDDLDKTPLEQDEAVNIIFAVGSTSYVLDLSHKHADQFHEALAPFIEVAHKVPAHKNKRNEYAPSLHERRKRRQNIRAWARENGKDVSDRGRIPSEIVQEYNLAHEQ